MKTHFVEDVLKLNAGERIESLFLLIDVKQCQKKDGSPYISFKLVDRTGSIEAKWWSCPDCRAESSRSQQFRFAKITGSVDTFQGRKQVKVSDTEWQPAPSNVSDYEMVAALPSTALCERLETHISSVQSPHLNSLLREIFDDNKFRAKFDHAPGAQNRHHACRHGLLQHTLEVTDLTASIAEAQTSWGYVSVSRDLAVAGALLHDVGKVKELTWTPQGEYGVSRFGELVGHIMIGVQWVNNKINEIKGFPLELREALLHIVASHHGKKEFGSPVTPMFAEAQIVHMADLLNVQLFYIQEAAQSATEDFTKVWKLDNQRFYTRPWESLMQPIKAQEAEASAVAEATQKLLVLRQTAPLWRNDALPLFHFRTGQPQAGSNTVFKTRCVPLIGRAAAGMPKFADGHIENHYDIEDDNLPSNCELFLLRVDGDSMTGDGIEDQDMVVVRQQEQCEKGEIAVVFLDEHQEAAIKRVRYNSGGTASLLSSNPKYLPLEIFDLNSLHICGRVIGLLREAAATA